MSGVLWRRLSRCREWEGGGSRIASGHYSTGRSPRPTCARGITEDVILLWIARTICCDWNGVGGRVSRAA